MRCPGPGHGGSARGLDQVLDEVEHAGVAVGEEVGAFVRECRGAEAVGGRGRFGGAGCLGGAGAGRWSGEVAAVVEPRRPAGTAARPPGPPAGNRKSVSDDRRATGARASRRICPKVLADLPPQSHPG